MANTIRVGVCGGAGKMGKEVVKTVLAQSDMTLVTVVDPGRAGEDAALVAGLSEPCGVSVESDLAEAMVKHQPQVVVDFTAPAFVLNNSLEILRHGGRCVIGTTGLSDEGMDQIRRMVEEKKTSAIVVPNFAIGAVLLMKFAQQASQYFDHAEIIEFHHNQKVDAPSGTAIKTALLMEEAQPRFAGTNIPESQEKEILAGSRGGKTDAGIRIHSVRLPGLVAHQEVIFGGVGQTLTLRHDSLDRTSFMPGVALAVRKMMALQGFYYGLETIL